MKTNVLTVRAVSMLLLWTTLYGCAGPKIDSGEVYDKQHEPAEDLVVMIPMVTSSGGTSTTTLLPSVVQEDEQWILSIRQWNEGEQRFDTNRLFVTPELFEQVAVGDWYPRCTECGVEKKPQGKPRE